MVWIHFRVPAGPGRWRFRGGMKKFAPFIVFALFISCGQWKVSAYNQSKLCSLKSGNLPGQVMVRVGEDGLFDLSFNILLARGRVYVADNILKRVQVLDRDGRAQVLIGEKVPVPVGDRLIQTQFNFSVLGDMAVDSDNNLYVQNRIASGGSGEELDFSPSYVLKFDEDGKLQYTLGKAGAPNIPFDYIDSMEIDRRDRLFVVSRKFNTWNVSRFDGKKRDFAINLSNGDFREREANTEYEGKIDNVKILRSGENFLVAVSFFSELRFKYRKIYSYSVKDSRIERTIMSIPDPKNELFTVVDDMHLYLWNIDVGRTRFIICNFDGNIVNNILIRFGEKKYFYRDVKIDESGIFYSYDVKRDHVEISEWR